MPVDLNPFVIMWTAEAARKRGDKYRVFDWDKAAQLIRDCKPKSADAGLAGDWSATSGTIYRHGAPLTGDSADFMHLASIWATPVLLLDGREIECWCYEDDAPPGWDCDTIWPESALTILRSKDTGCRGD